jgi:sugar phosphate isomerase/epimerase
MIVRVGAIAEAFADAGIVTALETGQESAETLVGVLEELGRDTVGVNFDPANMVLYGMGDPVEALRRLAPWVRQVHIKDAVPAGAPGVWGEERPVGTGGVDWPKFLGVLVQECPSIDLVIEREGGDTRVEDVRSAKALVQRLGAGRIEC